MCRPFVVLGVLVALLAGCGSDSTNEAEPVTVTQQETVTETVTTTSQAASGAGDCSAAGLSADLPDDPSLPAPVAEARREIAAAAVACDYERLQAIALEQDGFTYSYGGETSASDYWAGEEERGEQPMRILVESLRQDGHQYQGNWVWPEAYADAPSDEAWEELSGIYPPDQITSWREQGQFLGYRVGITPDGDWQFFVAGD
jgi:ABC-type glycerol-3-phosphate transport system substrate-binding protein